MPTKSLKGRYFLITEDEAKATWGAEYKGYWSQARGGYVLGYANYVSLKRLLSTWHLMANNHADSTSSTHFTV
jgi:hypothetical protein